MSSVKLSKFWLQADYKFVNYNEVSDCGLGSIFDSATIAMKTIRNSIYVVGVGEVPPIQCLRAEVSDV